MGSTSSIPMSRSPLPTTGTPRSPPCATSRTRDGLALLVGGTGLYLRTIARGLPLGRGDNDPAVRAELQARLDADGLDPLVAELRAP